MILSSWSLLYIIRGYTRVHTRHLNAGMADHACGPDHVLLEAAPVAIRAAGFVFDETQVAALVASERDARVQHAQGLEQGPEPPPHSGPPPAPVPPMEPMPMPGPAASACSGAAEAEAAEAQQLEDCEPQNQTDVASAFALAKAKHQHDSRELLLLTIAKQQVKLQKLSNEKKRVVQSSRRATTRDAKKRPPEDVT